MINGRSLGKKAGDRRKDRWEDCMEGGLEDCREERMEGSKEDCREEMCIRDRL